MEFKNLAAILDIMIYILNFKLLKVVIVPSFQYMFQTACHSLAFPRLTNHKSVPVAHYWFIQNSTPPIGQYSKENIRAFTGEHPVSTLIGHQNRFRFHPQPITVKQKPQK